MASNTYSALAGQLTTASFVSALQSNDEKAFSRLYDTYSSCLFFIVKRIVRSQSAAEDVLQNVFIKIFTNIQAYSIIKGTLFTWMLSIARNESIDYCRSKHGRAAGVTGALREDEIYTALCNEPALTQPDLLRSLRGMPSKEKTIIHLYTIGFTCLEIGRLLSLPEGTVKTKMRGIYKKLRVVLSN